MPKIAKDFLLWNAVCAAISLTLMLLYGMPRNPATIRLCIFAFVMTEGIFIYSAWESNRLRARLWDVKKLNVAQPYLHSHLQRIPNFPLGQWCILPSITGKRALAVNSDHTAIALLDYGILLNETDTLTTNVIETQDIQDVKMADTEWSEAELPVTANSLKMMLRLNQWGLSNGPILNATGEEIPLQPHSTASVSQPKVFAPLPGPNDTRIHQIRQVSLEITLNNSEATVYQLYFFLGDVGANAEAYVKAQQHAMHWQTVLTPHITK